MFGALSKLRQITAAARRGEHEEVLALASDPRVSSHRTAVQAREKALLALDAQVQQLVGSDELRRALLLLSRVRALADSPVRARRESEIRAALESRLAGEERRVATERSFAGLLAAGSVMAAERLLRDGAQGVDRAEAKRSLKLRSKELESLVSELSHARRDGRLDEALDHLEGLPSGIDSEGARKEFGALVQQVVRGAVAQRVVRLWALRARFARPQAALLEEERAAVQKALSKGLLALLEAGRLADAAAALEALRGAPEPALELDQALLTAVHEGLGARRAGERGDDREAERRYSAVDARLLRGSLAQECKLLRKRLTRVDEVLDQARSQQRSGELVKSRKLLLDAREELGEQAELQAELAALDARDRADIEALAALRSALGEADRARVAATVSPVREAAARRADLPDARLASDEADRLLARSVVLQRSVPPVQNARPSAAAAARRPRFRAATPPPLPPAPRPEHEAVEPCILRVEEAGDWLVMAGPSLTIGSVAGGVADLPVYAAIGSAHARIEREGGRGWRIVPGRGQAVSRNLRIVEGPVSLMHGDRVRLGRALELRFLAPLPDRPSAMLEFAGDFDVHGCRRVLLMPELGRDAGIRLGPGPHAHVPLGAEDEVLELYRDEGAPTRLVARAPLGVSRDGGEARPRLAAPLGCTLEVGSRRIHVDPLNQELRS